ncbi:potassium transporter [Parasulfuritortus cantonensis]|uniref:Potassium transporter n=1 Tax=Parasulfuritortus cantonensis TaxID=2528202 RepID=A0A4R1BE86_9PROT|nr:monovalent cation:proton antiporter family protein [Parasulfuritortus cantonensis]TCJ15419.1 potassium transporter [Parasulfuritortus cantonensis]
MHSTLALILLLLAAAVLVTTLFRVARLPALLGYVVVGILLGPSLLDMAPNDEETRSIAEFGVVFLMFSIGLEFSLAKLRAMRRLVFGLGGLQVLLTMVLATALGLAVGLSLEAGLALGGALAMSSTAIVSKMLVERNELETQHGRRIFGVLLFQDLAVVPLLIFIPALASGTDAMAEAMAYAGVKAVFALGIILVLGQRLLRPWLHLVAARKTPELFMLNVLLMTLGLAYVTGMAGLSLALGAFVAGMLISETEYRYQVESDIRPFRDVLMGLFFVTIGMTLDLAVVIHQLPGTLVMLALLVLAKLGLITLLTRRFADDWGTALRTGLGLAQAGEFGLVLLALAGDYQLIPFEIRQAALAAMILSMLLAPFLMHYGERWARRLTGWNWLSQAKGVHEIVLKSFGVSNHVILCGYGRSGQSLARILETEGVPFIALDDDPKRVSEAAAAGDNVVFGDCTRAEVLTAAGLNRARAVVVSFAHTPAALQVLATAHRLRPGAPVIVRTLDESDLDQLMAAGAMEVVPEVLEGALMLGSQTLLMAGVPLGAVLKRIRKMRELRYSTLRGYFQGTTDETAETGGQERLASVLIEAGQPGVGAKLGELGLAALGANVLAVRRHGIRATDPTDETCLEAGDTLILRGTAEVIEAAKLRLGVA